MFRIRFLEYEVVRNQLAYLSKMLRLSNQQRVRLINPYQYSQTMPINSHQ